MFSKTRDEAAKKGESQYFTGLACVNGHYSIRRTETGACRDCIKEANARRRAHIKDLIAKGGEK